MQVRYRIGLAGVSLVLFFTVCHRLLETPFWSYNGSRLMSSFALAHGLNYYVLMPPGGPLFSTQYGPIAAIAYLPATLFPSPNSAVLAGSAITVLLCFSAVAFLHFAQCAGGRSYVDALAFLTAGLLMCYLEPLKYSCFNIHADGPGLAFGAVACGVLYCGGGKWRAALPVSALCAVLSVFSKQMFAPVPLALLLYLPVARGRAAAVRYFLWLAAAGGLAAAASMIAVGPQRLYHCTIWMPGHASWVGASRVVGFITAGRLFIRQAMPVPVLLLACAIYLWASGRPRREDLRALAANRCVPLLLVVIVLLPLSFAGRAKTGGDINSLSFALFFLTCGLTVMLADIARAQSVSTRRLAISVLVATILPLAISEAPLVLDIPAKIRELPQTGQEAARAYLSRHPGEAYFPWFPLSHYYGEHQFRHYMWGIADRLLAGEPVSQADFRAYIPPDPRVIAFASDGTPELYGFDVMKYLPEYRCPVNEPELSGWLVYGKCGARASVQ